MDFVWQMFCLTSCFSSPGESICQAAHGLCHISRMWGNSFPIKFVLSFVLFMYTAGATLMKTASLNLYCSEKPEPCGSQLQAQLQQWRLENEKAAFESVGFNVKGYHCCEGQSHTQWFCKCLNNLSPSLTPCMFCLSSFLLALQRRTSHAGSADTREAAFCLVWAPVWFTSLVLYPAGGAPAAGSGHPQHHSSTHVGRVHVMPGKCVPPTPAGLVCWAR